MSSQALRKPFSDIGRQRETASFGMWLFLATEVLFFGGLFAGYAVYRTTLTQEFLTGARETEIVYGGINTAILLASSLAMAVGARAARAGLKEFARACFLATAILGAAFLTLKGFEYRDDIAKHLVPGAGFSIPSRGAEMFWAFYWVMTVVHAAHLVIGMGIVMRLYFAGVGAPDWLRESPAAEVTALYWHFVDAIWVVLFPLLYLAGRA